MYKLVILLSLLLSSYVHAERNEHGDVLHIQLSPDLPVSAISIEIEPGLPPIENLDMAFADLLVNGWSSNRSPLNLVLKVTRVLGTDGIFKPNFEGSLRAFELNGEPLGEALPVEIYARKNSRPFLTFAGVMNGKKVYQSARIAERLLSCGSAL